MTLYRVSITKDGKSQHHIINETTLRSFHEKLINKCIWEYCIHESQLPTRIDASISIPGKLRVEIGQFQTSTLKDLVL